MPTAFCTNIYKYFDRILNLGTAQVEDVVRKQRLTYFNGIIFTLPTVYFFFVLENFGAYRQPPSDWLFDQWSFLIFIVVCFVCGRLNQFGYSEFSKAFFIGLWPIILHVAPIVLQQVPPDYYYAFPTGIIFHSLMIQAVYPRRSDPFQFWFWIIANMLLMIFFIDILTYFDLDSQGELRELTSDNYYVVDGYLYWLLFNLVMTYMLHSIDETLIRLSASTKTVEKQKRELRDVLNQLEVSDNKIKSGKIISLDTFIAGIAHNLNNPLNYISSGVTILSDLVKKVRHKLSSKEDMFHEELTHLDKSFEAIQSGVDKSTTIIKSLHNCTHPHAGEQILYNVVQCLNDALALFPEKYLQGLQIEMELPEEVVLRCVPSKISQLFIIVLQNAIDSSKESGKVIIRGYKKIPNKITFEVQDNGKGIPEENLDKVFDPFFSTKEEGQGTGLGLYVAYAIVKEHGGSIEIKSVLASGTTVVITLPC